MSKSGIQLKEPDYSGVIKVISGGQCGSDFGGLVAAKECGIPTGGFIPKGFRTHHGPRPELGTDFGLVETIDFGYRTRTIKNVRDADGTVIFASNPISPGCSLTSSSARKLQKPCLIIQLFVEYDAHSHADTVIEWLKTNHISVLNVAGNRDKTGCFHEEATIEILKIAFQRLINNP